MTRLWTKSRFPWSPLRTRFPFLRRQHDRPFPRLGYCPLTAVNARCNGSFTIWQFLLRNRIRRSHNPKASVACHSPESLPVRWEQDGHLVGVVAPSDGHARGRVEAQELPDPRECFEAADGFGVFSPLPARPVIPRQFLA